MLKTQRQSSGSYQYIHFDGTVFIIERMYHWDTCKPTGLWTFRDANGSANDIFFSKREAIEALEVLLKLVN